MKQELPALSFIRQRERQQQLEGDLPASTEPNEKPTSEPAQKLSFTGLEVTINIPAQTITFEPEHGTPFSLMSNSKKTWTTHRLKVEKSFDDVMQHDRKSRTNKIQISLSSGERWIIKCQKDGKCIKRVATDKD
jgi:hypothetical protein